MVRRESEPDGGTCPPAAAGGRRLRAGRARQALSRPGGRCGPVRRSRADSPPDASTARRANQGEYQRRRFHRGDDGGLPRHRTAPRAESLMPRLERQAILAKLHALIEARRPIIGGGAGTGLSAKCEEAGGIDLIVIYNSGRYRMAGRGSLAGLLSYGDANAIVLEMAGEVLPVVKRTPVLAGVNGTDPFRDMDVFLDQVKAIGFAGVQNFPTVGIIDGVFRANLEETGMSYGLEIEM